VAGRRSSAPRIAILGLGLMGRAIAEGLLGGGHPRRRLVATTRTRPGAARLAAELGIEVGCDNAAAAAGADLVLLSLKPKKTLEVAAELGAAGALARRPLVVSIAAGVSIAALEARLGGAPGGRSKAVVPVVRAMPNTPCRIGKGTTVVAPGSAAGERHLAAARRLFEPLGRVIELEESHFDAVTGLSASGPAFVYVVLEALVDGGVARGLPRQVALQLAAQMCFGAAAMVLETGEHPAALKDDVTTPAGCTIAGILALEDGKIRSVLARAVEIAAERAGQLASGR
jgi:pyrroline-5-carboxylate reductase